MVFSMLVCNRDDHLRNHGFLQHSPGRWSLSPAYDLNPVPITEQVHESTTPISEAGTPATVTGALSVANSFGLTVADARDRIQTITAAVSTWKQTAAKLGLASKQVNAYASAFEHPVIDEARTIAAAPVSLAAARPRRGISP
jgi:serine/threonine-protein kinase HipA